MADLLDLLTELMDFLGAKDRYSNTTEDISRALFSDPPIYEAMIARHNGAPAGFVSWYEHYTLISGRQTMWIDGLYVRPEYRRQPFAMSMLAYLLMLARDRGCGRIEGAVLDWNEDAHALYRMLDAEKLSDSTYRMDVTKMDRYLPSR